MNVFTLLVPAAVLALAACSGKQDTGQTTTNDEYGEAMATEHADEEPSASPATEPDPKGIETSGEEVEYGTVAGKKVSGYYATPSVEGDYPAVILIHEWWGLNDNIRAMADKLAAQGYQALAVDLYGGQVGTTPDEAKAIMASVREPEAVENLKVARVWLSDVGKASRVGVMGWCFGGGWALQAGLTQGDAIDAVVMYYGRVLTKAEEVEPLAAPLLGLFGAEDQGIPVDQVKEFEAALKAAGEHASIHVYEGAGHAFANPSGPRYQEEAAKDAWQKTIQFLDRHLKAS